VTEFLEVLTRDELRRRVLSPSASAAPSKVPHHDCNACGLDELINRLKGAVCA